MTPVSGSISYLLLLPLGTSTMTSNSMLTSSLVAPTRGGMSQPGAALCHAVVKRKHPCVAAGAQPGQPLFPDVAGVAAALDQLARRPLQSRPSFGSLAGEVDADSLVDGKRGHPGHLHEPPAHGLVHHEADPGVMQAAAPDQHAGALGKRFEQPGQVRGLLAVAPVRVPGALELGP